MTKDFAACLGCGCGFVLPEPGDQDYGDDWGLMQTYCQRCYGHKIRGRSVERKFWFCYHCESTNELDRPHCWGCDEPRPPVPPPREPDRPHRFTNTKINELLPTPAGWSAWERSAADAAGPIAWRTTHDDPHAVVLLEHSNAVPAPALPATFSFQGLIDLHAPGLRAHTRVFLDPTNPEASVDELRALMTSVIEFLVKARRASEA